MKFSIITPVYNGEKHIAETVESVLSQEGDFEIEYIIIDGGSTDGTIDIIKSYDEKLHTGFYSVKCNGITFRWLSEKDNGMYDAINKGFYRATGDAYAYINSDDVYEQGAFEIIAITFRKYPEIQWLKGITSFIDENSKYRSGLCHIYNPKWIEAGIYGRYAPFIQQDSVFFHSGLWKKSGPIDERLRYAGDYFLWIKMSHYANLISVNKKVSCFRKRSGQLSENMARYRQEQDQIMPPTKSLIEKKAKLFFWIKSHTPEVLEPLLETLYQIIAPVELIYIQFNDKNTPLIHKTNSYKIK
jgi:glycosyltransferase involved in cell wall biosynthesis